MDADRKAQELGYESYTAYLDSPHWREIRNRLYADERRQCEVRGCSEWWSLQAHHLTYERLGAEELDDFVMICPDHHKQLHAFARTQGRRCDRALFTEFQDLW